MSRYQIISRGRGRGEHKKFEIPIVAFTPWQEEWELPKWAFVKDFATVAPGVVLLAIWADPTIYRSTDYGSTWKPTHGWDSFDNEGIGHIVNIGNGNVVVSCVNSSDVFYSSDYGITYTKASSPATRALLCMVCDGKGQLFASYGDTGSVMRSTDNGKNWYRMGAPRTGDFTTIWTETIAPLSSGVLLAGTCSNYPYYGPYARGGIYRSSDNGANWTHLYLFADCGETMGTIVHKLLDLGGGIVLAMVGFESNWDPRSKFYRSSDSGNTWAKITLGTGEYDVMDMITLGSGKVLISVDDGNSRGKFLLTKDYGVTWVEILDIGKFRYTDKLHATTPQIILAGVGEKVLKFTALGL